MMGNNAIKNALVKYLGDEKHLENNNLNDLKSEVDIIKSLRDVVDDNIMKTKISVINSSTHLLIDKIHRDDKEGVLRILKNTRDKTVFYDFVESMNELLINYYKYEENYKNESPELLDLKETFVLNDHQLNDLITEINLDSK
ncbi:MAG: hypothetical protein ACW980_20195 [Promethearchaeota archaeon]|jgi:hypothetical protein|tara:strand:+ start:1082 stop:1507 length:426 start_codon:yes stop_codon:yes gene_type:complete